MKKLQFFEWKFGVVAFLCVLSVCPTSTLPAGKSEPTNIGIKQEMKDVFVPRQWDEFTVFDWNLFKVMAKTYGGNILFSPLSVKMALVLLYEGAQDQTAHELADVMHLPNGRWPTRERFATIFRSLPPVFNEYSLDFGSRMYLHSGIDLKQSYAATVRNFYGVDVMSVNFANSSTTAAEINSWVSNLTHKNIEKMIEDDNSIRNSVMVIMNALYFKGSWLKNIFSPDDTKVGKFYTTANKSVDVPFMSTSGNFYYFDSLELDAKILRIPYVGGKFAMYFILPRTREGLEPLARNINPFILARQIYRLQSLPVEVKIPKFKFDFTSHMEKVLRELGIVDIFDNTATLNGIARAKLGSPTLAVSDIVQKAGIEVNEHGTVAFAATEIEIGYKMGEDEFVADHPFLFFIENEITGTILYMGKITNPLESNGNTETAIPPPLAVRTNDQGSSVPGFVTKKIINPSELIKREKLDLKLEINYYT